MRVQSLEFRVLGRGLRVQGSNMGFEVYGLGIGD